MKTFLTEFNKDGKLWAGPQIEAENFWKAEQLAKEQDVRVVGEFKGEISEGATVGETIKKLEEMDAPPEMIQDIIDIKRGTNNAR